MQKLADHPTKFIKYTCKLAEFLKWLLVIAFSFFLSSVFIVLLGAIILDGEIDLGHIVITALQVVFIATLIYYLYWFDYIEKMKRRHKDYREFRKIGFKVLFILINAIYSIAFINGLMWDILNIAIDPTSALIWSIILSTSFIIITISETHRFIDSFRPTWFEYYKTNYNEDEDMARFTEDYKNSKWYGRDVKSVSQKDEMIKSYSKQWYQFWK